MTYRSKRAKSRELSDKDLLDNISAIIKGISDLYSDLEPLDDELIDRINSNKIPNKDLVLDDGKIPLLKRYVNRIVDVEKMLKLYPHIYQLGLVQRFSVNELVNVVEDKDMVLKIVKECMVDNPKTAVKYVNQSYMNKKKRR